MAPFFVLLEVNFSIAVVFLATLLPR
jgi:hypothetical protein